MIMSSALVSRIWRATHNPNARVLSLTGRQLILLAIEM